MANFIKEIRNAQGLTLEQLADKVGTTPQQINFLEAGKRKLTWEWMQRVANALECHPLDLVEGPAVPKDNDEKELLKKFRGLEDRERQMFSHMLDGLSKGDKKKKETTDEQSTGRKRR